MLDNYKKDPDITAMVDMFDWYVLPVTNPDGYAYTWIDNEVSNICEVQSSTFLVYV